MNKVFYGLGSKNEAVVIARKICDVLGGGVNNTAIQLMVETAQQETLLGSFRDKRPLSHGIGLCQFDFIGFKDVQERTRPHINTKIFEHFGIKIRKVQHRDLAYSPFLSLLFCRLFYLLRPDPIPQSIDERADYWKQHYNTVKGKGTADEYIANHKTIPVNYL